MDELAAVGSWLISSMVMVYSALGGWGIFGCIVIGIPIFRRIVRLFKPVR